MGDTKLGFIMLSTLAALELAFVFVALPASPGAGAQPREETTPCAQAAGHYARCLREETRAFWTNGQISDDAFLREMRSIGEYGTCLMETCTNRDRAVSCAEKDIPAAAVLACVDLHSF